MTGEVRGPAVVSFQICKTKKSGCHTMLFNAAGNLFYKTKCMTLFLHLFTLTERTQLSCSKVRRQTWGCFQRTYRKFTAHF